MATAPFRIREALLPQDTPVIHEFILGLQRFEHGFEPNRRLDPAVAADYFATLQKKVHETNGIILIAEGENTHPIGWAAAHESEDEIFVVPEQRRIGYVAELYIVQEARGLGVGRSLIGACETWARERGLPLITIGVLSKNSRAFAMYERNGYDFIRHFVAEIFAVSLVIARAGMEAVGETGALIIEAADWLIAKGEPLWGPNETSHDELVHVTKAGELVTGRIAGELAACMYLHNEDTLFWPDDPPREAFYVHRLAVARKYAGRGLAHAMLEWAAQETSRERRPYLRLDCEPRPKLLALYRSAGFRRVDEKPIEIIGHFVVRHEKHV